MKCVIALAAAALLALAPAADARPAKRCTAKKATAAAKRCAKKRAPKPLAAPARAFAPTSFWYQRLPDQPALRPDSALLVAGLAGQVARYGQWVNTTQYTTPVYEVGATQPRVPVILDAADPALKAAFAAGVPLPADTRPSTGTDAHVTVWQPATDTVWEFWRLRRAADGWHAAWGGHLPGASRSNGVFPRPYGATASGLPLLGGLIRVKEMLAGSIDHVVALTVPEVTAGVVRAPATRTDGTIALGGGIPMGTRFQLDPGADLSGLSPAAQIIARAAQRYGIVIRDHGGIVSFYGEDASTFAANPWPDIFGGGQSAAQALRGFPWHRLRALA